MKRIRLIEAEKVETIKKAISEAEKRQAELLR